MTAVRMARGRAGRVTMTLYRPCVIRTAWVSAASTFVLFAVSQVVGPALVSASGDGGALVIGVLGCLLRVFVGRAVSLPTWRLGADYEVVLPSVAVGGLLGWVLFPGGVSVLGLLVTGGTASAWLSLLGSLVLWLACLLAGAALGRLGRWRGERAPAAAPGRVTRNRWTAPWSGRGQPPWR